MPEFALVAQDNCVPPDVLAFIAAAVNLQMQRDVAPAGAVTSGPASRSTA